VLMPLSPFPSQQSQQLSPPFQPVWPPFLTRSHIHSVNGVCHQVHWMAIQCQFRQTSNQILGVNAGRHQMQVGNAAHKDVALHIEHGQNATAAALDHEAPVNLQCPIATLPYCSNLWVCN
jgi:hypothetical protein